MLTTIGYHHCLHVPQFFSVLRQDPGIYLFFYFHFVVYWNRKILLNDNFFFLLTLSLAFWSELLFYYPLASFSHQYYLVVFHQSDSKSLLVSRILLCIRVDLDNTVVWMVSIHPLITNFYCLFSKTFQNHSKDTNCNWYHHQLHVPLLFSSRARSKYFFFAFDHFHCGLLEWQNLTRWQILFCLLINIKSVHLARIRGSFCISKSQKISKTDSGLCIYHFVVWSNFNLLHNSQLVTFSTQSCTPFCVISQHSLIMLLTILFLPPYNLHLLFCHVLSFLFQHSWSWLHYLVLLSKEIQFLTWGFSFLAMFWSFHFQWLQFVSWIINAVVFLLIFVFQFFLFNYVTIAIIFFFCCSFKCISQILAKLDPPSFLVTYMTSLSSSLLLLFYSFENFFTPMLADGLSLESERHQVFSSLQDSS